MSQEAIVGTPSDPAWPRGCTATLITYNVLPGRGLHPVLGAYRSEAEARAAAERDCGTKLTWSEHVGGRGQREHVSDSVVRTGREVFYAIWDWSDR